MGFDDILARTRRPDDDGGGDDDDESRRRVRSRFEFQDYQEEFAYWNHALHGVLLLALANILEETSQETKSRLDQTVRRAFLQVGADT